MVEVDLSGGWGTGLRRRRSAGERRQVVEETLEPGASVAKVALRHGVNGKRLVYAVLMCGSQSYVST